MGCSASRRSAASRATRLGALLVGGLLALSACGSLGNPAAAPKAAAPNSAGPKSDLSSPTRQSAAPSAQIKADTVTPSTLAVSTGQTVEIKNLDAYAHNLEDKTHHLYDGDVPAKGSEELTAPANPGTYVFTDRRHSKVKLTLVVS
jgi:plastocyanin